MRWMLMEIFDACRSRTWTARSTTSEVNCKYHRTPSFYIELQLIYNENYVGIRSIVKISAFRLGTFHHVTLSYDSSMKPTLKKVSKYENKFAKLQKKAAEFNFRNQLKQVKKKEFTLEEEDKEVRTIVFDRNLAFTWRDQSFFRKIGFFSPARRSSSRAFFIGSH